MSYSNNKYNITLQRKYMNKYFFDAIHHILKATATDENKQVLTKLYVKDDLICATNGHVLSWTNLTEGARELFKDTNKLSTSGAANNGLYTVKKRLTGSIELEQSCYTDIDYPDILSVIPDLSNYHKCSIAPGCSIKNNIALVKMALYNKKHDVTFTVIEKVYSPDCVIYFNDNPFDPVIFKNYFKMFAVFSLVMPIHSDFNDITYHDEKEM